MPTALELQREDWLHYKKGRERKPEFPQPTAGERQARERVFAQAGKLAKQLKEQFGVSRVVLFGSFARTTGFVGGSDVDLAVEDLDPKDYWQAWRLAEDVISDHPVDFVEIEAIGESLRKAIGRYGVEL